jgi:glyoxylase-like metal-dependent hydrolase (beta-lactamase superfamily II)
MNDPSPPRFDWRILQEGKLSIALDETPVPDGGYCTVTLIWPHGKMPSPDNAVLVDPCFVPAGYRRAAQEVEALGLSLPELARVFTTHLHGDHIPTVPRDVPSALFASPGLVRFYHAAGIEAVHCPGHAPDLYSLVFHTAADGEVWVVGDAILNREWLEAWAYYWPNGYGPFEIVETWRSAARILSRADVIVPGHGPPIRVGRALLERLLAAFPATAHADRCPDVAEVLHARLSESKAADQEAADEPKFALDG